MAVDRAEATAVLEAMLALRPTHDFVVMRERTERHPFGWIFFYAPRKYLETGNGDFLVPGTGPVVVTLSGEIVELTSSLPPTAAINEYLETWRRKR